MFWSTILKHIPITYLDPSLKSVGLKQKKNKRNKDIKYLIFKEHCAELYQKKREKKIHLKNQNSLKSFKLQIT